MRPYTHPATSEFSLERVLHALSDSIRLDIVRHLARVDAASCGELDGGRPKSTVSHHFKVLRESGLVHTETTGTVHMNTLRRGDIESRFPGLLSAILSQPGPRESCPNASCPNASCPNASGPSESTSS